MRGTFIDPTYRLCSGRRTVDGTLFISYSYGVGFYCQITEDGQVKTWSPNRAMTYRASVIGHGEICNAAGKPKKFQTQKAAALAGLAKLREMQFK